MQQNQPVQPVPTREQLEAQLTQSVLQRAALKDQLDEIEKQLPVINAMLQLVVAQEAEAEAKAEEVIED